MTLEQPLTNGAPPVLELVQGAAITPIHHIYVDGVWRQVRVAAARAARAEAATGTPFIEFLGGGPHHTVPVPPRILHPVGLQSRYVPSRQLPTGQQTVGRFIGMQKAARAKLPPTRFPSIILQYGVWVLFYSEKRFLALKRLARPKSGMISWWAGGIVQGLLGDLTMTGSLRIPDVDTIDRSLNSDLWIRILQVMQPDEDGVMTLRRSALVNRSWKGHAGALLDPASKWQKIRAAAMQAGDALMKT